MTKEITTKYDQLRESSSLKLHNFRSRAKRRTSHRGKRKAIKDSSIKNALFDLRHVIASGSQQSFSITSSDEDMNSEEDIVFAAIERIRQLENELAQTVSDSIPLHEIRSQFSPSIAVDKSPSTIPKLANPPNCAKKVKRTISKLAEGGGSKSRKALNL